MKRINLILGLLSATIGLGMLIYTASQQGVVFSMGIILGTLFLLNGTIRIWALAR